MKLGDDKWPECAAEFAEIVKGMEQLPHLDQIRFIRFVVYICPDLLTTRAFMKWADKMAKLPEVEQLMLGKAVPPYLK